MNPPPHQANEGRSGIDEAPERDRQAALRAVRRFVGFPALDDLRPVVLLHGAVHAEDGFVSGDAKMAFLQA